MISAGSGSIFFTELPLVFADFLTLLCCNGKVWFARLGSVLARELQPKNIHVAHFVIDGGISSKTRPDNGEDKLLNPEKLQKLIYTSIVKIGVLGPWKLS